MRRAPHEDHLRLFADVQAAMVIGDENPMREPERWRKHIAEHVRVPFWTVDADVVVPSKLIEKAQYGAYTIRPRLYRLLPEYLHPYENLKADHAWKRALRAFMRTRCTRTSRSAGKILDRSVKPVDAWTGGTHAGLKRLKLFTGKMLHDYEKQRNHPEVDGTSALSPYLHYGHVRAGDDCAGCRGCREEGTQSWRVRGTATSTS